MQSKFRSCLLSSLLFSTGIFLGLTVTLPEAQARIATNGPELNGTELKLDSASTSQLQLEGSQLVLHLESQTQ